MVAKLALFINTNTNNPKNETLLMSKICYNKQTQIVHFTGYKKQLKK